MRERSQYLANRAKVVQKHILRNDRQKSIGNETRLRPTFRHIPININPIAETEEEVVDH